MMNESAQPQGTWIEAITVFEELRAGNTDGALEVVRTCSDVERMLGYLFRLTSLFLRSARSEDIDHFIEAAHRAEPPPTLRYR
ncbi:hypothetical protein CXR25_05560 [Brevibacterium aurantiacum]|nr:hypothetical protein [Yaniella sp.]AZL05141.1 hypothetical protein CXR24_05680 [Brevibacterium aurantiacum]AZU00150.1 hypothetical protein CXR29_05025 [Brevibacterium linens]AZL08725.1 hypothetical protein CXR26_05385 [Brevibacterium aurantiacum]AZL12333.1 hypothetical protein CXR25_05560 [Brevibacterium aurantiacum]AZT96555.1 hypothetical protein CXR27_05680 [Brevibacterium aurantiacum]